MKDTPSSTHIPKIERLMGMLIEDIFPKILNNKLIKKTIQRPTIEYENIEIEYMSPQELYEPSYNPVCKMERFELTHRVLKIIATLTPREEKILRMRFGINDCEHTLQEIADAFSISQERVRGIEAKCLRKLRHPTRSKILKPFIY
jgi:RNA polymerase sigma factor (sigma-70 family)